jgi:hypothetical protein
MSSDVKSGAEDTQNSEPQCYKTLKHTPLLPDKCHTGYVICMFT